MSAGTTVATLPQTSNIEDWTEEERAVVEAAGLVFTFSYGPRENERVLAPRPIVAQFLHLAARTGLDPLARQIYCIGRQEGSGVSWAIQTGIDGFRVVAERSTKYAGQEPAEWLCADGETWVRAFIKGVHGDHPLAARVAVHRKDWDRNLPAVGIAVWDEYVQTKRDGSPTKMWATRGPGQLAKCAEALALRKAFPLDLSGLYTADELANAVALDDEAVAVEEAPANRSRVTRPSDASGAPVGAVFGGAAAAAAEAPVEPEEAEIVEEAPAADEPSEEEVLAGELVDARSLRELQRVWGVVVKAGLGKEPRLVALKEKRKAELSAPPTKGPKGGAGDSGAAEPVTDWPVAPIPSEKEAGE